MRGISLAENRLASQEGLCFTEEYSLLLATEWTPWPMISSGIETTTFRLLEQCLTQLRPIRDSVT